MMLTDETKVFHGDKTTYPKINSLQRVSRKQQEIGVLSWCTRK